MWKFYWLYSLCFVLKNVNSRIFMLTILLSWTKCKQPKYVRASRKKLLHRLLYFPNSKFMKWHIVQLTVTKFYLNQRPFSYVFLIQKRRKWNTTGFGSKWCRRKKKEETQATQICSESEFHSLIKVKLNKATCERRKIPF